MPISALKTDTFSPTFRVHVLWKQYFSYIFHLSTAPPIQLYSFVPTLQKWSGLHFFLAYRFDSRIFNDSKTRIGNISIPPKG